MLAFTLLHQGLPATGAEWIRRSLEHAEALDDPFNLSCARELAAQYHATAGDRDAALRHADAAIAFATEHGFPVHAAVATAMCGWALRGARLWELRAVTSLSRLWRAHGRKAKARTLLDAVYGAFTEGFDTPDLVGARELRAQL